MNDSLHVLEDLNDVFTTLYAELGVCREELQRDHAIQYRRRLLIREFCTFVEVVAYHFKRLSLYITQKMIPDIRAAGHVTNKDELLSPFMDTLSPSEVMLLEERSPVSRRQRRSIFETYVPTHRTKHPFRFFYVSQGRQDRRSCRFCGTGLAIYGGDYRGSQSTDTSKAPQRPDGFRREPRCARHSQRLASQSEK